MALVGTSRTVTSVTRYSSNPVTVNVLAAPTVQLLYCTEDGSLVPVQLGIAGENGIEWVTPALP